MKTYLSPMVAGISLMFFTYAAQAADTKKGESLFTSRACVSCHSIGSEGSAATGPNLAGVGKRRTTEWLVRWITAPDKMTGDPVYKELKLKFPADMPNMGLSDDEVRSLVLYLKEKSGANP